MRSFKDYIKSLPLRTRIELKLSNWWLKFRIKIGLCPHDCSVGEVGEKTHYCMCGKEVENEDWEIEKKHLTK